MHSPDGKWFWNGTEWVPVIVKPKVQTSIPSTPPTPIVPLSAPPQPAIPFGRPTSVLESKVGNHSSAEERQKLGNILRVVGIVTIILAMSWMIYAVVETKRCENAVYEDSNYEDSSSNVTTQNDIAYDESDYCWVNDEIAFPFFPIGIIIFIMGFYIHRSNDTIRLKEKAILEFAAGNIAKAKTYYKKLGDLDKLEECTRLLNNNVTTQNDITIQNEPSKIDVESVFSGERKIKHAATIVMGVIGSLLITNAKATPSKQVCETVYGGAFNWPRQDCHYESELTFLGLDPELQIVIGFSMMALALISEIVFFIIKKIIK